MDMAIFESYIWWYTKGWRIFILRVRAFLLSITDFFSMSSLVRTLFKPFRQISAESTSSSPALDLRFQMFIDRLVSRIVGFTSRIVLLIVGSILLILSSVISLVVIILWPFIPIMPIIGLVLTISGVIL